MKDDKVIKQKIANSLLNQNDPTKCKRQIWIYLTVLIALLLIHGYCSNLDSALKLIPQTFTAVCIGYILLCIYSLRQFKHVSEFIDWSKVYKSLD